MNTNEHEKVFMSEKKHKQTYINFLIKSNSRTYIYLI